MIRSRAFHPGMGLLRRLVGLALTVLALLWSRGADAQIKQPCAHPSDSLELDTHLVIQHENGTFLDDEGWGVGCRASIPFVHNGPIPQINNNMGISFGGDLAFFDDDAGCRSRENTPLGDDC